MSALFIACTGAAIVFSLGCAACSNPPGRVEAASEVSRPEQVMEFAALYRQNCAACHGENGKAGAAIALDNPVYLAASGESAIRKVVANGVPGMLMPAFEKAAGGTLTSAQVDSLVQGILREWGRADALAGVHLLSYANDPRGDPVPGQKAFVEFCGRCHGPDGAGAHTNAADAVSGSIIDSSYLALLSDQSLRSTIIGGRPDEGMPDWRSDIAGHPMTDQEVTDVVAWLATFRRKVQ